MICNSNYFRLLLQNRSLLRISCFHKKDSTVRNSSNTTSKTSVVIEHETKFGSLANAATFEVKQEFFAPQKFKTLEDLEDGDGESEHFAKISDIYRPRPGDFERKIESLLSKRQLARALEVFDDEMTNEKVKPNLETFKLMIHACGKAGYAYKAGELLHRYRSGGTSATFGMFANVFHACANAPDETKEASLR